jgi:hypothetical protein
MRPKGRGTDPAVIRKLGLDIYRDLKLRILEKTKNAGTRDG